MIDAILKRLKRVSDTKKQLTRPVPRLAVELIWAVVANVCTVDQFGCRREGGGVASRRSKNPLKGDFDHSMQYNVRSHSSQHITGNTLAKAGFDREVCATNRWKDFCSNIEVLPCFALMFSQLWGNSYPHLELRPKPLMVFTHVSYPQKRSPRPLQNVSLKIIETFKTLTALLAFTWF